jgi:hypothetical protein
VEITNRKLSTCTSVMTFTSGWVNPQEQVQEAGLFLNFANLLYVKQVKENICFQVF